MKIKTTAKNIKVNSDAVCFGYCELQDLLRGCEPFAYTCGVYGWNADIYSTNTAKTIVTGYRPFGREPKITWEQVREYNRKAAAIWSWDNPESYDQKEWKVAELRREFYKVI